MLDRVKLSICSLVRNEWQYLEEWIEYHRMLGCERFYLYDDGSDDETLDLASSIEGVVARSWSDGDHAEYRASDAGAWRDSSQVTAFNHWIKNHRYESEYVAFIDPDEYMYHSRLNDLRYHMPYRVAEAARWLPWYFFGDNGHIDQPHGLTIREYTRRGRFLEPHPYGRMGKIVAESCKLDHFGPYGPHNAEFSHGYAADDSQSMVRKAYYSVPKEGCWKLCHYAHRSRNDCANKLVRGNRNLPRGTVYNIRLERCNLCDVEDRCMEPHWMKLKYLMEHSGGRWVRRKASG